MRNRKVKTQYRREAKQIRKLMPVVAASTLAGMAGLWTVHYYRVRGRL